MNSAIWSVQSHDSLENVIGKKVALEEPQAISLEAWLSAKVTSPQAKSIVSTLASVAFGDRWQAADVMQSGPQECQFLSGFSSAKSL